MGSGLKTGITTGSRRRFLKATGLAAIGSAIGTPVAANAVDSSNSMASEEHAAEPKSPVDLVNLLQGSDSTPVFSRGNTLPIATLPFGMGHWTLQSSANSPWMFQPGERRIQGLRLTHQLSPWLSDYGQTTFLPLRGEIDPETGASAS